VNLANPVRIGLKWFVDLSSFSTTEEKILAVYEAAVPTELTQRKLQNSPGSVYKYGFGYAYF